MSEDRPKCRYCGDPATHEGSAPTCCWCHVVEDDAPPADFHPECLRSERRIKPIQARFRSAIEATRENCVTLIHEGLKQPLEAMPRLLRVKFRTQPEVALQAILDTAAEGLTTMIRMRIKP